MSIIDKLYNEWYMAEYSFHPDTGEAQERFRALWTKAQEALDEEFSEELRNSIFAYMYDECTRDFRAGFRLGALWMLDLQLPAAPAGTEP